MLLALFSIAFAQDAPAPGIMDLQKIGAIQFTGAAYLGDYDMSKEAFALTDSSGKRPLPLTISGLSMNPDHGPLNYTRGNALQVLSHVAGNGGNLLNNLTYLVTVPPATYTALAVDEGAARQYAVGRGVGTPGAGRRVLINLDIAIANQTPVYTPRSPKGDSPQVRFQGTVSKIR